MINKVFPIKILSLLTFIVFSNYTKGFTQRGFFEETNSPYICECFTFNSKGNKGKKLDYKIFFNYSDAASYIHQKRYYQFQTNILFGIDASYLRYADNKIFNYNAYNNLAYLEDKIIDESILIDFSAKVGQK